MSYIESKKAKKDMNKVLIDAMADGVIYRPEAFLIVEELNKLQEVTRKECIKLLKQHGHIEVAEQYNKLEFLDASPRSVGIDPKKKQFLNDTFGKRMTDQIEDRVVKAIWPDSFPEPTVPTPPKIRPKTKQRLIWLAITGSAAVISVLLKLGFIL